MKTSRRCALCCSRSYHHCSLVIVPIRKWIMRVVMYTRKSIQSPKSKDYLLKEGTRQICLQLLIPSCTIPKLYFEADVWLPSFRVRSFPSVKRITTPLSHICILILPPSLGTLPSTSTFHLRSTRHERLTRLPECPFRNRDSNTQQGDPSPWASGWTGNYGKSWVW